MGRAGLGIRSEGEVSSLGLTGDFLALVRIGMRMCKEHKLPIREPSNRDINGIFLGWEGGVPYYKVSSWTDKHMKELLDSRPWLTPQVLDWLKTFSFFYSELEVLWENSPRLLGWLRRQKGALAVYLTLRGPVPDVGNVGYQKILNRICYLMGEDKLYEEYYGV